MDKKGFLKAMEKMYSANTLRSYENDLDLLALDIKGDEPIAEEIIVHLNKIESMSTLTRHKASIQSYWQWRYPEVNEQGIPLKPLFFPRRIFAGKKQEVWRPVDPKEMENIIAHVTDPDDKFLLETYNILGCRAREPLNITKDDILLNGVRMRVKGGKVRTVLADSVYLARLRAYAWGKEGRIFKQSYYHIYRVVKDVAASLGYTNIRPHDYRHSYTENLFDADVPRDKIYQLRGDKNDKMLARYNRRNEKDLQQEIEKARKKGNS